VPLAALVALAEAPVEALVEPFELEWLREAHFVRNWRTDLEFRDAA
jgi:hypothetical protein